MAETTSDALLGGRVRLIQPRAGFRAATDALLLAAACPAAPGERVLDLGCGVGAASLALLARVGTLAAHGLEIDADTADLARRNAADSGAELTVHLGDVADPPPALKALSFDHVIANPPWFEAEARPSPLPARDAARRETAGGVTLWTDAALKRLRQGGWLSMIHLVEKLPEILAALAGRAGTISVLPLSPRAGRDARRMILTAKKDSRGPFRIAQPFVIHAGQAHNGDQDDFTPEALAVLRDAAPLRF